MALRPITFGEDELKKLFRTDTPLARFWRTAKKPLRTIVLFLVLYGIFFLAINFPAYFKRASYSVSPVPTITVPPVPALKVSYTPEILIPKLGLEAPVIYDSAYTDILANLRNGVVRYEGSADPGQVGNVVILGHSSDFPWSTGHYKTIFALLDRLELGDPIIIPFGTEKYTYTVTQKNIIKATDLSVLSQTATPKLTLITCYPVGTALKRLVIVADLTAGPVGATQTAQPFLGQSLLSTR